MKKNPPSAGAGNGLDHSEWSGLEPTQKISEDIKADTLTPQPPADSDRDLFPDRRGNERENIIRFVVLETNSKKKLKWRVERYG